MSSDLVTAPSSSCLLWVAPAAVALCHDQKVISPALYSCRSEEWSTPGDLYEVLNQEFRFSLDPCASLVNAKCVKFFTKEEDGLKQDWSGERVFMNPPYGKHIGLWMQKARAEARRGALVVCLVHARTDTRWWHENTVYADEVRFLKGRVRFLTKDGVASSSPFPSALVIFRPKLNPTGNQP